MKKFLSGLATGLFLVGMVGMAEATPITYYFSGNITSIENKYSGGDPVSHPNIDVGDGFSGFFTFDFDEATLFWGNSISNTYDDATGESYIKVGEMAWSNSIGSRMAVSDNGSSHSIRLDFGSWAPRLYQYAYPGWNDFSLPSSLTGIFSFNYSETIDGILRNIEGETTYFSDVPISDPVPEPATMLLFVTGIAGLAGTRIRGQKKRNKLPRLKTS